EQEPGPRVKLVRPAGRSSLTRGPEPCTPVGRSTGVRSGTTQPTMDRTDLAGRWRSPGDATQPRACPRLRCCFSQPIWWLLSVDPTVLVWPPRFPRLLQPKHTMGHLPSTLH